MTVESTPAADTPPAGPPAPDFLPAEYHAARARRRVAVWRSTAAAAVVGLLIAGVLGGLWRTRRLQAERDATVARAAALATLDAQVAALETARAAADGRAAVLAGLHLRTPPSRLLADLAAALPDGVTLTDLTLARRPVPPPDRAAKKAAEKLAEDDPVAADAAALARRRRGERLELRLTGTAPDDAAVARLLASAAAAGSFDAVELLFTDRAPDRRGRSGRREDEERRGGRAFAVRLTARPAAEAD